MDLGNLLLVESNDLELGADDQREIREEKLKSCARDNAQVGVSLTLQNFGGRGWSNCVIKLIRVLQDQTSPIAFLKRQVCNTYMMVIA